MNIFRDVTIAEMLDQNYFVVTYVLTSNTNLKDAAEKLAIGQSIGNPNVRSYWETDELIENHACKILSHPNIENVGAGRPGVVSIAFPADNISMRTDGISQLLCQTMGGQTDIDAIQSCRIIDIKFPESMKWNFLGPKFGIHGIRETTKVYNKPLLGGIVKPKVGLPPNKLLEIVREMVEGGINFIKEDEIMSNPLHCSISQRIPLIADYLADKDVIYAACINSDPHYLLKRCERVYELGKHCNIGVHVNLWSGLGSYKAIRALDLPLFLFFQKSGDKVITDRNNRFSIDWNVICHLAGLSGVDFIHAGMWGGYMHTTDAELSKTLEILRGHNVLPSLSCGMHPGLVNTITRRFGNDYMANVGGALHGHSGGTMAGVMAMRQAIDEDWDGKEYKEAVEKWGLVR